MKWESSEAHLQERDRRFGMELKDLQQLLPRLCRTALELSSPRRSNQTPDKFSQPSETGTPIVTATTERIEVTGPKKEKASTQEEEALPLSTYVSNRREGMVEVEQSQGALASEIDFKDDETFKNLVLDCLHRTGRTVDSFGYYREETEKERIQLNSLTNSSIVNSVCDDEGASQKRPRDVLKVDGLVVQKQPSKKSRPLMGLS